MKTAASELSGPIKIPILRIHVSEQIVRYSYSRENAQTWRITTKSSASHANIGFVSPWRKKTRARSRRNARGRPPMTDARAGNLKNQQARSRGARPVQLSGSRAHYATPRQMELREIVRGRKKKKAREEEHCTIVYRGVICRRRCSQRRCPLRIQEARARKQAGKVHDSRPCPPRSRARERIVKFQ